MVLCYTTLIQVQSLRGRKIGSMILLLKADDEEQSQRENNCTVRGHSDHDLNLTVTTVCTRDCSAGLDIETKF